MLDRRFASHRKSCYMSGVIQVAQRRSRAAGTAFTPYGRIDWISTFVIETLANKCASVCVSRVIAVTKKIRCVTTLISLLYN